MPAQYFPVPQQVNPGVAMGQGLAQFGRGLGEWGEARTERRKEEEEKRRRDEADQLQRTLAVLKMAIEGNVPPELIPLVYDAAFRKMGKDKTGKDILTPTEQIQKLAQAVEDSEQNKEKRQQQAKLEALRAEAEAKLDVEWKYGQAQVPSPQGAADIGRGMGASLGTFGGLPPQVGAGMGAGFGQLLAPEFTEPRWRVEARQKRQAREIEGLPPETQAEIGLREAQAEYYRRQAKKEPAQKDPLIGAGREIDAITGNIDDAIEDLQKQRSAWANTFSDEAAGKILEIDAKIADLQARKARARVEHYKKYGVKVEEGGVSGLTEKIKVREKSTGRVGEISPENFDPARFEKVK